MKKLLKKYPVVISLILICLIFAIVTTFFQGMYDLFAFHSKPIYIWQYSSGIFMHGVKEAPIWLLWVHLFMNCLMIISFGSILENKTGSRNTFIILVGAIILSSIFFHFLLYNQEDTLATGISPVCYAFLTGAIINMKDSWKSFSKKLRCFYITFIVLSLVVLLPSITGWVTTLVHLSGIISYVVFSFITSHCFKQRI